MMVTFTDINLALERAIERSDADSTKEDFMTELLQLSAGITNSGIVHYRPYYVAAYTLQQDLDIQILEEADKAIFTGQKVPIASLLALQSAYDQTYGLIIPPGFEPVLSPLSVLQVDSSVNYSRPALPFAAKVFQSLHSP